MSPKASSPSRVSPFGSAPRLVRRATGTRKLFHAFRSVIAQRMPAYLGPAAAFFLAKMCKSWKTGFWRAVEKSKARAEAPVVVGRLAKEPSATPSDRFLPLGEARGQQIYRDRGFAARGPVAWRLDGSGRVWFA